jgi:DNA polymerase-1
MRILIDGDILVYTVAYKVETAIDWGDDLWTLHADLREAKMRLDLDILEFREILGAKQVRVALSDSTNFRMKVWSDYKAHRADTRKPVVYRELRQYVRDVWRAQSRRRLEADDLLGIWATKEPGNVIVSADKDLKTIPGQVYNPNQPDLGVYEVSLEEADRNHLVQTLSGDRADGYPGCPGIGDKRAQAIAEGGWPAVVEAYAKAGLSEEYAITQARLARILRAEDYSKGRIRLWEPSR